jgi:hypothetical protein
MYIGYIDGEADRKDPMNDDKKDDQEDEVLRERFGRIGDAFKERFEMTKPGVEPIKDKTRDKRDKD